jgi:hypothetical protein
MDAVRRGGGPGRRRADRRRRARGHPDRERRRGEHHPESSISQAAGEELLTGDVEEQVEAAVLAEYPDATIERTETDSCGVYESHIVTADGDRLTVLVDEEFAVTGTETGGRGGRGPGGGDCPEDDAGTTEEPGTSESPGSATPSVDGPSAG